MYNLRIADRAWAETFKSFLPLLNVSNNGGVSCAADGSESPCAAELEHLPGMSGLGVFYNQCLNADKLKSSSGRKVGDKAYWKNVKARWANVLEDDPPRAAALAKVGRHNASKSRSGKSCPERNDNHTLPHAALSHAQQDQLLQALDNQNTCYPCDSDSEMLLPRLRPDAQCPTCGITGSDHFRPIQRFESLLRRASSTYNQFDATPAGGRKKKKAPTPKQLATTPISTELYAHERVKWSGGLRRMETLFDSSVCGLGRDIGHDESELRPLRRCKFGLCSKELRTVPARTSIVSQLTADLRKIISLAGGPKKIPESQPSAA